uniref:Uncharacterized protein n=1 Tax=Panagrolaimus davidi TaxID=227884 RepID=A0A914PBB7_9BILA
MDFLSPYDLKTFFVPKKLKPNVVKIDIRHVTLSINQLVFIGNSIKICDFYNISVKNDDGIDASLAEIIQCLPNVEDFKLQCPRFSLRTSSTEFKKLCEILHLSKIKKFTLHHILGELDIEQFYEQFLKINKTVDVKLWFKSNISETYKQKLETIAYKILESKSDEFWPPIFYGTFCEKQQSDLLI